jgi:hypothetical protein
MSMPGAQCPAVAALKCRQRYKAIGPRADNLEMFALLEQRQRPTGGKNSRRKTHCRFQDFFLADAALQHFPHFGKHCGTAGTLRQITHHLFVLLIQLLTGNIFFPHLFLQFCVGVEQLTRTLLDLLFQQLLVAHLIVNIGAASKPLLDRSRSVAQRHRAIDEPAIPVFLIAKPIFDFKRLSGMHAVIPFLPAHRQIVGVHEFRPRIAQAFPLGGSRHLVPALVDVVRLPIRSGSPHDQWNRFRQAAELGGSVPRRQQRRCPQRSPLHHHVQHQGEDEDKNHPQAENWVLVTAIKKAGCQQFSPRTRTRQSARGAY